MSRSIGIYAVPKGTVEWAVNKESFDGPNEISHLGLRSNTDNSLIYVISGYGIGPRESSINKLYSELTGRKDDDFWGSPALDQYKRALAGGDHYVNLGSDYGLGRFSTSDEAAEAAETVRKIGTEGGPNARRGWLFDWTFEIANYCLFFELYKPGEELFYYIY